MNSKMTTVHNTVKRTFNANQFLRVTIADVPLSHISVLLYIGLQSDENIGKTQLERVLDMSTSTMSRILQRLGAGSGDNERVKGLGLIDIYEDPMDWRLKRVKLNKKGQEVLDGYARIVNQEVI